MINGKRHKHKPRRKNAQRSNLRRRQRNTSFFHQDKRTAPDKAQKNEEAPAKQFGIHYEAKLQVLI